MDRERTDDVFETRSKKSRMKDSVDLRVRDVKLAKAFKQSKETGKITPLLKEELKCRIQARRHSEGKQELVIKFDAPKISENKMSPESLARLEKRREQNRRASKKLRTKKRDEENILMNKLLQLDADRKKWQAEIETLNEEKKHLQELVRQHACNHLNGQSNILEPEVTVHDETVVPILHEMYNETSSNTSPCLTNPRLEQIQEPMTYVNELRYASNDCMMGTNTANLVTSIDNQSEEMENFEDAFETLSDYPVSPTDTIPMCTDNTDCRYENQEYGVQSLDESNPYGRADANFENFHSPNEQKTTEHFVYPDPIELVSCGSLDLNEGMQLEDMIRQYSYDVSLDHACQDMSYFNMVASGHPVTP